MCAFGLAASHKIGLRTPFDRERPRKGFDMMMMGYNSCYNSCNNSCNNSNSCSCIDVKPPLALTAAPCGQVISVDPVELRKLMVETGCCGGGGGGSAVETGTYLPTVEMTGPGGLTIVADQAQYARLADWVMVQGSATITAAAVAAEHQVYLTLPFPSALMFPYPGTGFIDDTPYAHTLMVSRAAMPSSGVPCVSALLRMDKAGTAVGSFAFAYLAVPRG